MNRLELLASLTKGYETLADIGSDHAYVCIDSVKNYGIKRAYACDINELPLENAKRNIIKNNLSNEIETILSNGLNKLNENVDLVLISGMGGLLISEILKNDLNKVKRVKKLILQPNNEIMELREFLMENNFNITNEHNIIDKTKYYEVIECVYSNEKKIYSNQDLMFGPFLRQEKNENFITHYNRIINLLEKNISKVNNQDALNELNAKINFIKQAL